MYYYLQSKEQDPMSELSAEKIHWNFKENKFLPISQEEQQTGNVARMIVRRLNVAVLTLIKIVSEVNGDLTQVWKHKYNVQRCLAPTADIDFH